MDFGVGGLGFGSVKVGCGWVLLWVGADVGVGGIFVGGLLGLSRFGRGFKLFRVNGRLGVDCSDSVSGCGFRCVIWVWLLACFGMSGLGGL